MLTFQPILPYATAFAAGACFVVIEEVIPAMDKYTDIATMGFMIGLSCQSDLDKTGILLKSCVIEPQRCWG